jgi:hypothetical protein
MICPNRLDRLARLVKLLKLLAGKSNPAVELPARSRAEERGWLLLLLL